MTSVSTLVTPVMTSKRSCDDEVEVVSVERAALTGSRQCQPLYDHDTRASVPPASRRTATPVPIHTSQLGDEDGCKSDQSASQSVFLLAQLLQRC